MQEVIFSIFVVVAVWVALKEHEKKKAKKEEGNKAPEKQKQQSTVVPAPVVVRADQPTKLPSRLAKLHPWVEMCQAEEKLQQHYEILAQTPAVFRKAAAKAKSKKQRNRAA